MRTDDRSETGLSVMLRTLETLRRAHDLAEMATACVSDRNRAITVAFYRELLGWPSPW